jgi:MFS family permease
MESWPGAKRPLLAGLIGAAANAGYALIALIAIVFPITQVSWRWVMMVGAAPALLTFFIRLFVPESERWRQSVKHGPSRPVREILRAPLLRNTLLAIGFASIALIVT